MEDPFGEGREGCCVTQAREITWSRVDLLMHLTVLSGDRNRESLKKFTQFG